MNDSSSGEGSTTVTRDEGGAVALATSIPDEFEVEKSSMDNDEIGDDASCRSFQLIIIISYYFVILSL